MKIELLSITPDAEKIIEMAGRTAYQSQDKINDESATKFIKMLVKRGHTSVLEHAVATFKIGDVSRAFSHQLLRHRLASYTQKSQRYCSNKDFEYIIPDSIKNNNTAYKVFNIAMSECKKAYNDLQELGIRNEDARFVLPEACTTEIVITANFREWRHIIDLRTEPAAQWEIKNVCIEILKILKEKAPSCFVDLSAPDLSELPPDKSGWLPPTIPKDLVAQHMSEQERNVVGSALKGPVYQGQPVNSNNDVNTYIDIAMQGGTIHPPDKSSGILCPSTPHYNEARASIHE